MGAARSYGGVRATLEDDEFDAASEERSEVRCINVSPYTARIEIATVPGSKPRRHRLDPGQGVYLQHGYTVTFIGAGGRDVRPTIESLTEREAWPGRRDHDKDGKLVWLVKPGPRLPMVVAEDRAADVKAQWDAALRQREENQSAPLRLTLQRQDGQDVEVEADIAPRRPKAKARPIVDDEDQSGGPVDEPPPEHDDPIEPDPDPGVEPAEEPEPVELPEIPSDPVPTRASARNRRGNT